MITLLHNPACSKSGCAMDYSLQFPGVAIQTRWYVQDPLSKTELQELVQKLQLPVREIVRTNEKDFIAQFGTESLDEDTYLDILVQQPQFLQRPILIDGNKAFIGRPPELILDYLKSL